MQDVCSFVLFPCTCELGGGGDDWSSIPSFSWRRWVDWLLVMNFVFSLLFCNFLKVSNPVLSSSWVSNCLGEPIALEHPNLCCWSSLASLILPLSKKVKSFFWVGVMNFRRFLNSEYCSFYPPWVEKYFRWSLCLGILNLSYSLFFPLHVLLSFC